MIKCLHVKFNAHSKSIQGFTSNGEHEVNIPSTLGPPRKNSELMLFVKKFWVEEQLGRYGAGPEGEFPEIEIFRITHREVIRG